MDKDDPSTWSTDRLVVELCHSPDLFLAAGEGRDCPDPAVLEIRLRTYGVNGSTFLDLDLNTLGDGLGISDLGHTLALAAVIKLLKTRSLAHKQQSTTEGVGALDVGDRRISHDNTSTTTKIQPTDASGRKRQRVTHMTTAPLPTHKQQGESMLSALGLRMGQPPTVDGNGEWDYLERWKKAGQHVIDVEDLTADEDLERWKKADQHVIDVEDLTADMDLEEEELNGISEPAEQEQRQEPADTEEPETNPGRSKLSDEQIAAVINERIEHFQSIWTVNKGVEKGDEIDYDPEKMWQEAEATGQRQALIKKHEDDLAYYTQRLDILCKEIQDYAGNSVERLRHQCGVLEVTVDAMELSEWLRSIYALPPEDGSEEDEDEDEDEEMHTPTSIGVSDSRARPVLHTQEIIDLGSPPDSSQEIPDEMIVDSSPPPMGHSEVHPSHTPRNAPDQFYAPNAAVVEDDEPLFVAPPASVAGPSMTRTRPQRHYGDEPQNASIASAKQWQWSELADQKDSKRCVTKALQEMASQERETIRNRLQAVGKADMIREIPACLQMLAKNENKMQGVLARDLPKIVTFTRLFLCWWLHDDYFRLEPSKWHLEELQQCLDGHSPDPSTFYDYLNTVMMTTFSPEALLHPEQPSQAEVVEISSDEDEPAPKPAVQRKSRTQHTQSSQHPVTITID